MSGRLTDRTLWRLLIAACLVLLAAIGFAVWLNTASPLSPVPATSSARA